MDELRVDVDPTAGTVSVWNNGAGVPVVVHADEKVYVPELIFGHLLTSSNYDDAQKKVSEREAWRTGGRAARRREETRAATPPDPLALSLLQVTGGRNGYGAKLANIFSTRFVVETADGARRKAYSQTFENNMGVTHPPTITPCAPSDNWTRVTFTPDLAKFGMDRLEPDTVALFRKRAFDAAAVLGRSGLAVSFNGARVPVRSFADYVRLCLPAETPKAAVKLGDRWEVVVAPSDGQFHQVSFVNAIATVKGGTHVNAIVDQISKHIAESLAKKHKGCGVKPFMVKNQMAVFVNAQIENPAFDSQAREGGREGGRRAWLARARGRAPTPSPPSPPPPRPRRRSPCARPRSAPPASSRTNSSRRSPTRASPSASSRSRRQSRSAPSKPATAPSAPASRACPSSWTPTMRGGSIRSTAPSSSRKATRPNPWSSAASPSPAGTGTASSPCAANCSTCGTRARRRWRATRRFRTSNRFSACNTARCTSPPRRSATATS